MNTRIVRIVGSTQLQPARAFGRVGAYARRCLLVLAAVFATIGGETAAQDAGASIEKPDLFYFVVDRSASMKDKKLVEPVSGAVIEFLGRAPAGCEVRLVFFGNVATKHWQWRNVGTKEKSTIYNEFRRNFVPEGDTRLYDTVAEALKAIIPHADQYRQIQLIVLTDGDDTRSKDYRSWESLAGLAGPLVGDHPNSLLTLYTLGFTPKDKPGTPWQHVPVANVTGNFKLQQPRPNARFLLSPEQAAVGEPILFVLMSEVGVESVQWNFGDGEDATTAKPTHRYQKVGNYKVTATATGSGGEDSRSVTVSVLDKVPLQARFEWFPPIVRVGQDINLQDRSSGNPSSRAWSIPGQPARTNRDETVRFTQSGPVTIGLSLATGTERSTTNRTFTVLPLPPNADFDVTPLTVDAGQTITLNSRADQPGWVHTWTIGSDLILKGPTQRWKADQTGPIEITHTVEGPGGMSAPAQRTAFVGKNVPLKAHFTHVPRVVRVGQEITFIDESEFGATSWSWTIAGQPARSSRTTTATFSTTGKVRVALTVRRDDKTDTEVQELEVLPKPAERPDAAFDAQPVTLDVGQTVGLNARFDAKGWLHTWQIGTRLTLKGAKQSWKADQTGPVEIIHTVEGPGGVSVPVGRTVFVGKNIPLTARFSHTPPNVRVGQEVTFIDESEFGATSWSWAIVGQPARSGRFTTATFASSGKVRVALTVRRDDKTDTAVQEIEVLPKLPDRPDAAFDVQPVTLDAGQTVSLNARFDERGWIHTWIIGSDLTLKGPKQSWKADRTGPVEITHTAEGPGGLSIPVRHTIFVGKNVPLTARFTHAPRIVRVGQEVTLIDESEFAATSWFWVVPGQPSKSTRTATATFASAGKVPISLTVKRDDKSDTITQEIEVLPKLAEKPDAAFSVQPRVAKVGEQVKLSALDTRPEIRHEWKIPGSPPLTGATVMWVAAQAGTVPVTHVATGADGTSASRDDELVVPKPQLVVVKFAASPVSGVAPLTVRFKSECEGEIAGYQWDFGNGSSSDLKNPEHAFSAPGTFSVRLTVRNVAGETSSSTEKFEILVKAPPKPLPGWVWPTIGIVGATCLLAFIYSAFLKPPPIEGTLVVEFQGQPAKHPLFGTEFDLAETAVGTWAPEPGEFIVRNKGGIQLFGTPDGPIALEHQCSFELKARNTEGQTCRVTYLAP